MEVEGLRYQGKDVLKILRKLRMTARIPITLGLRPTLEQIQWHFDHLALTNPEMKKLWVFREPKRIKEKDSQYKQLLSDWGMRRSVRRQPEPTLEWGGDTLTWAQVPATPNPPRPFLIRVNRRQRPAPIGSPPNEDVIRFSTPPRIDYFGDQLI